MGSVSPTFDEFNDLKIVDCLLETGNPYDCSSDITQTRLPFYIHAFAAKFLGAKVHHWISLFFSFFSFVLCYVFANRHFGKRLALIFCVLLVLSAPILASGRMLLTHSNSIFLHFSLWSVFSFYEYVKHKKAQYFFGAAIFWGLSLASSMLAILNPIFFLVYYLLEIKHLRFRWFYPLFPIIGLALFFASTIIYTNGELFDVFWEKVAEGPEYLHWNYFNLNRVDAPFWFSWLIFGIKINPLLALLFLAFPFFYRRIADKQQAKFLLSLYLFVGIYLILKSVVFKYDTPHHQVHYYPFVYLVLAFSLEKLYSLLNTKFKRGLMLVLAIGFILIQSIAIYRFFPNYLFYGAQYGEAFIGEFYGPAVMHGQDTKAVWAKIDEIIEGNPDVKLLYYDKGVLKSKGKNYVNFKQIRPENKVDYVLIDYVSALHLRFWNNQAFKDYAFENCESYYTYYFPTKKWAYQIRKCAN